MIQLVGLSTYYRASFTRQNLKIILCFCIGTRLLAVETLSP